MADLEKTMEGYELKEGSRIIVLRAPYYEDIVAKLERGVELAADERQSKWHEDIKDIKDVSEVAGALELPLTLSLLAYHHRAAIKEGKLGIIALGCVIRGETEHFSLICNAVFNGLQKVALEHSIALGTGVLACDNEAQALKRAEKTGRQAFEACFSLMLLRQNFLAKEW